MKPKHYPHVTLAAAIALLLLPASMLLLISSPKSQSIKELISAADSERHLASTISQPPLATAAVEQRPATRIAMLSPKNGQQAMPLDSPKITVDYSTTAGTPVARPATFNAAPSKAAAADAAITRSAIAENKPSSESFASRSHDQPIASETDANSSHRFQASKLDQEMNAALAQHSSTDNSHFESTGHLAMSDRRIPTSSSQAQTNRSARLRNSLESNADTGIPELLDEDPFASEPKTPIVDMLIQQPSERRPVSKVENLIATTQQPGWPIALVRSDIPDDVWWVQQMVGIRQRTFASRVNFGNDNSLPGSVYHLVIVFLDSADEARRFRIAKQFKDLPEGLRRSRQYTFVRK